MYCSYLRVFYNVRVTNTIGIIAVYIAYAVLRFESMTYGSESDVLSTITPGMNQCPDRGPGDTDVTDQT